MRKVDEVRADLLRRAEGMKAESRVIVRGEWLSWFGEYGVDPASAPAADLAIAVGAGLVKVMADLAAGASAADRRSPLVVAMVEAAMLSMVALADLLASADGVSGD